MKRRLPALALLPALLTLTACAEGAQTSAMTVRPPLASTTATTPLQNAVAVGTISGGSDTNPLWISEVSNENFHDALQSSLAVQSLLATGTPRYTLDAQLISLQQPYVALNTTVTADVRYTVRKGSGTQVAYSTELATPFTASLIGTPIGFMRLQVANEGAMRANIAAVIGALQAATQPGQPLAPPTR